MSLRLASVLLSFILTIACTAPRAAGPTDGPPAGGTAPSKSLVIAVRYETTDLAPKIPGNSGPANVKSVFNAGLSQTDPEGVTHPLLAESLPRLNTESWQVLPDGRMETTYRLRSGLTWHDGRPLTAADFAFAWRVYADPTLRLFSPTPQDHIQEIVATDPRSFIIRWKSAFVDADILQDNFPPLPQHLLGQAFDEYQAAPTARESFANLPFWTTEYIGAGPYRLTEWSQGSRLEGVAFADYVLGRPKIDRVIIRIFNDENTVLANVLSGEVDYSVHFTLRFEHARVLQREWEPGGRGVVMLDRSVPGVTMWTQIRPEYALDPGQLDVRVRRALAYTIDRSALNDGLFEGKGFTSDTLISDNHPHYSEANPQLTHYPYDPAQADRLMVEAGFTKGADGFFARPNGERFRTDVRVTAGPEFERMGLILVDTWRRFGVEAASSVLPAAQAADNQTRQTFPGMASRGGGFDSRYMIAAEIGSPANRWTGNNRSGWSHPDYEQLYQAFSVALDRQDRARLEIRIAKLISEQLPFHVLYDALQVRTARAGLQGLSSRPAAPLPPTVNNQTYWGLHEWQMR